MRRHSSGVDMGRDLALSYLRPSELIPKCQFEKMGVGGNTYYVSIEKVVTDDPEALLKGDG
jgi:hypothetical protein